MKIGEAKFDASVQILTGVHPDIKLKLSAPVFNDAYIYFFGLPFSANAYKAEIIGEIEKALEKALQA